MRWRAAVWALVGAAAACGGEGEPAPARPVQPTGGLGGAMVFAGSCDASGAVWLEGSLIAVADDEDNLLRIYDSAAPGAPAGVVETASVLADPRGKHPEMDLEAAARIGDRIYWLASHGRKKSGKPAPSRLRLFATDVGADGQLAFAGTVYERLVEDLAALPGIELAVAAARSPTAQGGLNIEGLGETAGGQLLLGFRSPVLPDGRALVVPVENPAAMVERGERAVLGAPIRIDLGGRGVRAMERDGERHFILGGARGARIEPARLYVWDGRGAAAREVAGVGFGDLNPEALAWVGGRLLVVSDDGERAMAGGRPCKKLKDAGARRFRAAWVLNPE
ncbi:MAG TPA: DUF3616 domain-containing protein [Kofleriaceae bacterium]|nr:DUF3616 domain-containing protein [Kofleriaceae bacterium]